MTRPRDEVDPLEAWGADASASAYERGRPSYPPDAVAHVVGALDLHPGRRVLDVGAGTGKCTRLLVATGAEVVAVEPAVAMRDALARNVAEAEVREGSAEALPLPDASVDAVVAATAFHWFDHARAMPELARVLRPGGMLACLWNERDEREPWVRRMTEIIGWDGFRPYGVAFDWRPVVEHDGWFELRERVQFPFVQQLDRASMADRVRSISYVAAMSEAQRAPLLARIDELVAPLGEPFELPYLCDVVLARRA